MRKIQFIGLPVLILVCGLMLVGCASVPRSGSGDSVWLADVSNPFIGTWESDIPSANMRLIFDYKTDGTFDYQIPGLPANQGGEGTGGYLVAGNVMVSYLGFEGVAGYTFKVVDNDTIDVTEIEEVKEDGSLVLGNTAPFTRVAGSPVNKENKPFVLSNPLIGTWSATIPNPEEPDNPYETLQEYRQDGTAQFTLPDYVFPTAYYFFIDDVLVTFDPSSNEYESFTFTYNGDGTFTGQELLGINPDGSRELGLEATYYSYQ